MKLNKAVENFSKNGVPIKMKLVLSMSSIAAVLLISCFITVMEFVKMNNYLSGLMEEDLDAINVAGTLSDMSNAYNLDVLTAIGEVSAGEDVIDMPHFDGEYFKSNCGKLSRNLQSAKVSTLADSVLYSYSAYMLTALELEDVMASGYKETQNWYFSRLQSRHRRLQDDIDELSDAIHQDLKSRTDSYNRGVYRSLVPGIVAIGAGILLVLMMLYFMMTGYANPICRMLDSLKAYRNRGQKYSYTFEGDDQLHTLNEEIKEIASENDRLRSRIAALKRKEQPEQDNR